MILRHVLGVSVAGDDAATVVFALILDASKVSIIGVFASTLGVEGLASTWLSNGNLAGKGFPVTNQAFGTTL